MTRPCGNRGVPPNCPDIAPPPGCEASEWASGRGFNRAPYNPCAAPFACAEAFARAESCAVLPLLAPPLLFEQKKSAPNGREKVIAYVMYAKPKSAASALGLHKSVFGGKVPLHDLSHDPSIHDSSPPPAAALPKEKEQQTLAPNNISHPAPFPRAHIYIFILFGKRHQRN